MTYYLSFHANKRAREMNLDEKTISELVLHPNTAHQCPSRQDPRKLIWLLRKGDLTAFADKDRNGDWIVITVVPATEEKWRELYPEQRGDRVVKPEVWAGAR